MKTVLSLALFTALAVPCLANGPAPAPCGPKGCGKVVDLPTLAFDAQTQKPKKHPKKPNPNNGPAPAPCSPKGCGKGTN
jgi:hypothetical protein